MVSITKPMDKSRVWSRVFFVVALLGMSLGAVATPSEPADDGLFAEVAAEDGSAAADDPTVVRSRLVTVDFAQLGTPDDSVADALVLNLFDDAVYTAALDRVETSSLGAFSWIGDLEGVALSQVILTVKDGVMVGNVVAPGLFYQVRYVGDGVHAIREADQAAFPPEAPPIPVDLPAEDSTQPSGPTDDGSTIDVLVIYTDDARAAAGGTTAMQNLIQTAVVETNAGYANSGINQRVNLVHTAEISYDESGFDWSTTLYRFRTYGDGYFDTVTAPGTGLRDTYFADESVLIVSQSYNSTCGMGYMMTSVSHGFEDWAFVVVARSCATGYYSFGHEMGHNMGAHHDWYVNTSTAPYPYNHGFVNYPDLWRTIMAYNTRCSDHGASCTRLNYWSNPDVPYGGDPMGVVTTGPTNCNYKSLTPDPSTCAADNRTTLNNTAYTVANFRVGNNAPNTPSAPSPADGATEQSPDVDLSWTGGDPNPGDTVTYDVYFKDSAASSYTQICNDVTSPSCDPGALALNAHYYWYVVATDSHSESTTGPEWDFYTITNAPPNTPSNPSPADGATGQSLDVDLSWTGGDPDLGDTVTYDVYFKESASTFTRICDDVTTPSCDPGALALNAHYYWYVAAFDSHGAFTVGPTWEFYAISNDPPYAPSFPLPADGATGESVDVELAWTGGDPDAGDTVTYTVYLDTSSPPGSQICQDTTTMCDPPGSLAPNTPYYWQVAASDSYGEVTPGPVWDFTTGTATGPTIRGYVRDASLAALAGVTVTFGGSLTITSGSDGYYAQTGLGGGTVTVTVEADGYTFSPWLDQVTLGGDVTHNVTGYPLTHAVRFFSDDFESGSLGSAWAVETDYEGRAWVGTSDSHTGSYSLLLDDDTAGGFTSHASAILPLDLSGETEVKLSFWWRDFTDEQVGGDGVFISDNDGATWHQVYSFTDSPTFTLATIDLDEAVSAAPGGMTLNEQFLVKFQFYDDYPVTADGYAIDDVVVYSNRYNVYLPVIMSRWP